MQAFAETEMTWVERALKQGRQEGQHEGMRTLLLFQLGWKFGELPQDFVDKLNTITDPTGFAKISKQLLTAKTLTEIKLPARQ